MWQQGQHQQPTNRPTDQANNRSNLINTGTVQHEWSFRAHRPKGGTTHAALEIERRNGGQNTFFLVTTICPGYFCGWPLDEMLQRKTISTLCLILPPGVGPKLAPGGALRRNVGAKERCGPPRGGGPRLAIPPTASKFLWWWWCLCVCVCFDCVLIVLVSVRICVCLCVSSVFRVWKTRAHLRSCARCLTTSAEHLEQSASAGCGRPKRCAELFGFALVTLPFAQRPHFIGHNGTRAP